MSEVTAWKFLTFICGFFALLFGSAFVILMRIFRRGFWVCTNLDHGPGGVSRFVPHLSKCPGCGRREGDS